MTWRLSGGAAGTRQRMIMSSATKHCRVLIHLLTIAASPLLSQSATPYPVELGHE